MNNICRIFSLDPRRLQMWGHESTHIRKNQGCPARCSTCATWRVMPAVALASKMIWLGGWGDVVQLYCYGGCGGQDLGQVQGKVAAISDKAMQIHKPKLGVRKGFSTRKAVHLVVVDVAPCEINQSCPEVRGNEFQMPQRRGVAALVSGLLK